MNVERTDHPSRRRHARRTIVAISAAAALTFAGCGSDDDESAETEPTTAVSPAATTGATTEDGSAGTPASSAVTTVTSGESTATTAAPVDGGGATLQVTTLGLCNEIPVFWAQDKGIFEKNGVTVELVQSQGGSAAVAALQSGAVDLAFTNPFSTMLAVNSGVDLQWVATAYETPTDENEATSAIAVKEGGSIETAQDLEGKTVGVNEVGGINQIVTSEWIKMEGADPTKVEFVALPFNQLAPSVAGGQVDAAQTLSQLIDPAEGIVSIADPFIAVGNGQPLIFAGYVTTGSKVEESEAAMQAFHASLVEADTAINDPANATEKYEIEEANCGQPADVLAELPENTFVAEVSEVALDRMGEILVGQGLADEAPSGEELTPEWARA